MADPVEAPWRPVAGFRVLRLRQPLGRRLAQLLPGLVLFGVALALGVEGMLGVNPWTVFHGGAADKLGLSIGTLVILTGLVLLALSWLLHEPIGLGTLLNVVVIGPAMDLTLWIIPDLESIGWRLAALGVAPALLGLASGLYIGAGLGPGPRDGLMTALERRGLPVWAARTAIEVSALTLGWFMGGDVGVGTLWFALTVGWWVQRFLARLRIDSDRSDKGD